jgi:Putative TM nitroreductase
MTQSQLRRNDGGADPREQLHRSALWRLKERLQFTGWLQYLLTAIASAPFLVVAGIGWLIGNWRLQLFWLPLAIGLVLLVIAIFDVITVRWDIRPCEPVPGRQDDLGTFDLIRARRSCRSFQTRNLTPEHRAEVDRAVEQWVRQDHLIGSSPIRLEYVAARLTVWPTVGAHEFLVAIAPRSYDRLVIIDIGRSLQHVVLRATRMGVATCWIGPGADQASVINHLGDRFDPGRDHVICVCAIGYRSRFEPLAIRVIGRIQHRRLPLSSLFFADPQFEDPLPVDAAPFASFGRCYEVCQWSPSSFNSQTTRCAAITTFVGTETDVVRFDFASATTSRFYAPVAVGIWCANWETGCAALGRSGHFAVLTAEQRNTPDAPVLPRYDVSWVVDNKSPTTDRGSAAGG